MRQTGERIAFKSAKHLRDAGQIYGSADSSLHGSVIAAAPRRAHSRLVNLYSDSSVAAVVLQITGVIAKQVLAAEIPAQHFDRFRQLIQFADADHSASCFIGDSLQEARSLEHAECDANGIN